MNLILSWILDMIMFCLFVLIVKFTFDFLYDNFFKDLFK